MFWKFKLHKCFWYCYIVNLDLINLNLISSFIFISNGVFLPKFNFQLQNLRCTISLFVRDIYNAKRETFTPVHMPALTETQLKIVTHEFYKKMAVSELLWMHDRKHILTTWYINCLPIQLEILNY